MEPKEFFSETFHTKALVIRASQFSAKRLVAVKKALFNLSLKKMLTNSASEMLHVWQPNKK
jgi:hypothetical protein